MERFHGRNFYQQQWQQRFSASVAMMQQSYISGEIDTYFNIRTEELTGEIIKLDCSMEELKLRKKTTLSELNRIRQQNELIASTSSVASHTYVLMYYIH